jgi:protein-L-isoaspartate(D-aspartate) O-methyltransferase
VVVVAEGSPLIYERARGRMVASLAGLVADERVLAAMAEVPRHLFVEEALRGRSYDLCSLPIGLGQTISHPLTVARMTEALELTGGERVLEVGTGSGYQTAVLARLCANVYTVERIAALGIRARRLLEQLGNYNVALQVGDGTIGWRSEAPFDAIIVTAGSPTAPRPLLGQLRTGGRLVVPVGQEGGQALLRLCVTERGVREEVIGDCRFVPLLGRFGFAR